MPTASRPWAPSSMWRDTMVVDDEAGGDGRAIRRSRCSGCGRAGGPSARSAIGAQPKATPAARLFALISTEARMRSLLRGRRATGLGRRADGVRRASRRRRAAASLRMHGVAGPGARFDVLDRLPRHAGDVRCSRQARCALAVGGGHQLVVELIEQRARLYAAWAAVMAVRSESGPGRRRVGLQTAGPPLSETRPTPLTWPMPRGRPAGVEVMAALSGARPPYTGGAAGAVRRR